jgi:hypothetical protein
VQPCVVVSRWNNGVLGNVTNSTSNTSSLKPLLQPLGAVCAPGMCNVTATLLRLDGTPARSAKLTHASIPLTASLLAGSNSTGTATVCFSSLTVAGAPRESQYLLQLDIAGEVVPGNTILVTVAPMQVGSLAFTTQPPLLTTIGKPFRVATRVLSLGGQPLLGAVVSVTPVLLMSPSYLAGPTTNGTNSTNSSSSGGGGASGGGGNIGPAALRARLAPTLVVGQLFSASITSLWHQVRRAPTHTQLSLHSSLFRVHDMNNGERK